LQRACKRAITCARQTWGLVRAHNTTKHTQHNKTHTHTHNKTLGGSLKLTCLCMHNFTPHTHTHTYTHTHTTTTTTTAAAKIFVRRRKNKKKVNKSKPGNCPVCSESKILAKISAGSLCPRYYEGEGSEREKPVVRRRIHYDHARPTHGGGGGYGSSGWWLVVVVACG